MRTGRFWRGAGPYRCANGDSHLSRTAGDLARGGWGCAEVVTVSLRSWHGSDLDEQGRRGA
jgi:hypothetical protein